MSPTRGVWWGVSLVLLLGCGTSSQSELSDTGSGGGGGFSSNGGANGGTAATRPFVSEGCISVPAVGHHIYGCDDISFDVEVPSQCQTQDCGVILDVHGWSMNGFWENANTDMQRRGRENGYVVLQPTAREGWWDPSGVVDEAMFDMIERSIRVYHLDDRRVHVTGFSAGGLVSWRLLCLHSEVLSSIAPIAGPLGCPPDECANPCNFDGDAVPASEVPILLTHGKKDLFVPFSEAEQQLQRLSLAWGLDAGTEVAGDDTFSRVRYVSLLGTEVEFIAHDYNHQELCSGYDIGGHCFPGSSDPGNLPNEGCSLTCDPPSSFDWGAEAMKFFIAHPKRQPT